MREMVIDEKTLALDLIKEVAASGGDFLDTDHTMAHYREDYYPELTERGNFDAWAANGGPTLRERARGKVDSILGAHCCSTLPEDIERRLCDIVTSSGSRRKPTQPPAS